MNDREIDVLLGKLDDLKSSGLKVLLVLYAVGGEAMVIDLTRYGIRHSVAYTSIERLAYLHLVEKTSERPLRVKLTDKGARFAEKFLQALKELE